MFIPSRIEIEQIRVFPSFLKIDQIAKTKRTQFFFLLDLRFLVKCKIGPLAKSFAS
jgi:hypothetical protein